MSLLLNIISFAWVGILVIIVRDKQLPFLSETEKEAYSCKFTDPIARLS